MTKMPETMRVTMILERDQIVQGFITQQSILFNSVQQSTSPSLSTYSKASFLSWSFRSNFLMRHFHYHVEHSLHKIWGIWGTRPPATSQLDHVAPLTRWSIWEHNGRREGGDSRWLGMWRRVRRWSFGDQAKSWHWFGDILKGRIGQFGAGRKSKWGWGWGGRGWKRVRVTVQISRGFLLSFGPTVAFQRRLRSDSFVKKSNKFERPKLIISLFILTLLATHFVQNSSNISHIYHFCQVSQGSTRISHTLWLILHWREQNYAKLLKVTSIGSMHVRTILYHAIPHKLKG